MSSWKTHQNFGLLIYLLYAFILGYSRSDFIGTIFLSSVLALIGALFPDVLDPPNRWKHRVTAHSTTRFKNVSAMVATGFVLSFLTVYAIPVTAFLIGYFSHLLADSTTASGLPRLNLSLKASQNNSAFTLIDHEQNYVPEEQPSLQNLFLNAKTTKGNSLVYLIHSPCWKRLLTIGNTAKIRLVRLNKKDIKKYGLDKVIDTAIERWKGTGAIGDIDREPLYFTDDEIDFVKSVRQTKIEEFYM